MSVCLSIDVNEVLLMYAEACCHECMLIYLFINAFFTHKALSHFFFSFLFVCVLVFLNFVTMIASLACMC